MNSRFEDWLEKPQTPEDRAMFDSLRQAIDEKQPPEIRDGVHWSPFGPSSEIVLTFCREKWSGLCSICGKRFTAEPPRQYLEHRSDWDAFQVCPDCAHDIGFRIDKEFAREYEPVLLPRT